MPTPMHSDKGKQILAQAMEEGRTVLEFTENESGEHIVMDITDHVEQLEEKIDVGT